MLSLTETLYWKAVNEVAKIEEMLKKAIPNLPKYTIPKESYKHLVEFRVFKYPLVKLVDTIMSKGVIVPVLFSEAVDLSNKEKYLLPNLFIIPIRDGSDFKILVDLQIIAKYTRNATTGRVELLDVEPRQFYGFMQAAAVSYVMLKKETSLKNGPFMQKLIRCYSRMLVKAIDRDYPIQHNEQDSVTASFIVGLFAFKVLLGLPLGEALDAAHKSAEGAKPLVESVYRVLSLEIDTMKLENIDDMVTLLETYLSNLKPGKVTHHSISKNYTRMFGSNAAWAIESLPIYFQMLQMANMWLGLYQDKSVQVQSAAYYKDLEKLVSSFEL